MLVALHKIYLRIKNISEESAIFWKWTLLFQNHNTTPFWITEIYKQNYARSRATRPEQQIAPFYVFGGSLIIINSCSS